MNAPRRNLIVWGVLVGLSAAGVTMLAGPPDRADAQPAPATSAPQPPPVGPPATSPALAAPLTVKDVSLAQAAAAVDAALAKAAALDVRVTVAVVDAGGNLKAFARMDGAWLGSVDIAHRKARTSRQFDMPTGELGRLSQPGGPLFQIEASNGGMVTFPGGVPLRSADGQVIGAVGVSGTTVDNDHAVAVAAAAVVK